SITHVDGAAGDVDRPIVPAASGAVLLDVGAVGEGDVLKGHIARRVAIAGIVPDVHAAAHHLPGAGRRGEGHVVAIFDEHGRAAADVIEDEVVDLHAAAPGNAEVPAAAALGAQLTQEDVRFVAAVVQASVPVGGAERSVAGV